ncbi:receptor protein kinase-like protein At4g34220 [Aegilops tauschii subsp. strangulata]|uniref:Protein kinase domain-containing protein n=2 Tax=Aegilops tauschii subsp. strangulata TaxID=200361 RepID=A0A453KG51_AEGTS|nr:probable LRR receptor-like serine/threonine-protein kinase At4g37250 [Aegilops tauschii subsp. strangulata]
MPLPLPSHHRRRLATSMAAAARRPLLLPISWLLVLLLGVHAASQLAVALDQDGVLLLSFKSSLLADPLGSLSGWGYADPTPCAWNGIVCMAFPATSSSDQMRVVSVILPNEQLVGPISPELGRIEHLRHLDLSGNALNGTLPVDLFRAPELRILSLASNGITGGLPEQVGQLRSLRALNLAGNALSGAIPGNLTLLQNLTAVSLASNYFSGALPGGGFPALQVLDVSSNMLNGTLPVDFGGAALRYVNLSSNRLAGAIPPEMASHLPANVTIDLSFNKLTGAIPMVAPFVAQRTTAFAGNDKLCGRPLDSLCSDASASAVDPPNGTAKSPPALAAIPNNPTETMPGSGAPSSGGGQGSRLKVATIIAIAAGDVAGIAILFAVFFYVYQVRKRKQRQEVAKQRMGAAVFKKPDPSDESPDVAGRSLSCCPGKKAGDDSDDTEEDVTDTSASFVAKEENHKAGEGAVAAKKAKERSVLVTVGGEVELELETLLKASAYILGAAGDSIVYKAVLADGAALAVRRIGSEDAGVRRFSEFDAQMRAIAKLRHGNILRLRGFYWGPDEMLLIHDLAANGSLANASVKRKPGTPPMNLGWSARLRIARGVARGLAYLHDKKCVHGNVRPSNILLDADMEPLLADLGIHRLVRGAGDSRLKPAGRFGSKRSAKSLPDLSPPPPGAGGASPLAGAGPSSSAEAAAHYQAPEAAKNPTKPSAKWDVYSFGMVLLELVAGRALTSVELCQWAAGEGEGQQAFLLADAALRGEMEGREETLASCLRLGFACCAAAPGKRPAMKDVLQAIDRIPSPSSNSCSSAQ